MAQHPDERASHSTRQHQLQQAAKTARTHKHFNAGTDVPAAARRRRQRRRRSCVSWPDSRRARFGERIRTIIHGTEVRPSHEHRHMRVVGLMAYIYRIHPIRLGRDKNHSSAAAAAECLCAGVGHADAPSTLAAHGDRSGWSDSTSKRTGAQITKLSAAVLPGFSGRGNRFDK